MGEHSALTSQTKVEMIIMAIQLEVLLRDIATY